jgi:hypothetical protein
VDQKFFLELPATRKYTNKHAEWSKAVLTVELYNALSSVS